MRDIRYGIIFFLTVLFTAAVQAASGEWAELFNKKDLTGWENPYAWGRAEAVDGEIHLTTDKSKWFLVTKKEYDDFVFEVEVKMPDGKCNSGFMFRAHKEKKRVFGYQAEVDTSDRKWSGGLYDEGRRKWFVSPNRDNAASEDERDASIDAFRKRAGDCFKRSDWNKYRIVCRGDHIQIFVNGIMTTDCHDDEDAKGYIALQHHGERGQTYRFRNIRIMELKEGVALPSVSIAAADAGSYVKGGWVSLFDGRTLDGWKANGGKKPSSGWVVEDDCIHRKSKGGNIYSEKEYENFELEFEWKISPKGNSGIKYRFRKSRGPEYQILDDGAHVNGRNEYTSAASMYLMQKPNDKKVLKAVGEFNKAKIVARGSYLEHWLNGEKILEMEVGSTEWNTQKEKTKFRNITNFGEGAGLIQIQDHGDLVWYRNIRIRTLTVN